MVRFIMYKNKEGRFRTWTKSPVKTSRPGLLVLLIILEILVFYQLETKIPTLYTGKYYFSGNDLKF